MNITIIGGGSWGSSIANLLTDNKNDVLIYDTNQATVKEINNNHTNKDKLGEVQLSNKIKATLNLSEALNFSDLIILAVPTSVIRIVLKKINELLEHKKIFCNVSKGLEIKTHNRVSEVLREEINSKLIESYVVLSGPSHAEEVVRRKITSVVSASIDIKYAKMIQTIFSNEYFRVYTTNDLIGVELSGSLKNIFAIAAGIVDGLGYGINTKAALITRGLQEMKRIVGKLGGDLLTLDGLVGVGDLIVTCTSSLSRNYSAGKLIAKGEQINSAVKEIHMVVEGVKTCKSAYHLAQDIGVDTPIINAMYNILYKNAVPEKELNKLMSRRLIGEQEKL